MSIQPDAENRSSAGTWKDGRVVLDEPVHWPEGVRLQVSVLGPKEAGPGHTEAEWPETPEEIAEFLVRMDQIEPLEMTPDEEANRDAWRKTMRDHELSRQSQRIEELFE